MPPDLPALLAIARAAAQRAGAVILEIYGEDFAIRRKADASPVTLADERAERLILAALREAAPAIPVIAEEEAAANGLPGAAPPLFWLVDPLDGTKEFIGRNGEFTVNIALVAGERPILGIVHVPVTGETYAGLGPGTATRQTGAAPPAPIRARRPPPDGLVVVHSRSHDRKAALDAFLIGRRVAGRRVCGSSVKFCALAAGDADLYPRLGPTMEWDTAAGHAVLLAAGGRVTGLDGAPFTYGKPGFRNPGFIATGL